MPYSKRIKYIEILKLINELKVKKTQTQLEESIGDRSQDWKGLLKHKS